MLAAPAAAQGLIAPTQRYGTPLYNTRPSTLDKNYGLPTFGMPGSELPKQRTMAPVGRQAATPSPDGRGPDGKRAPTPSPADDSPEAASGKVPDFFAAARKLVLPSERSSGAGETPLFTTTDGSTRSVFAMPNAGGTAVETPLLTTTGDGDTDGLAR